MTPPLISRGATGTLISNERVHMIDIRTADADDAAGIARVHINTWQVAYDGLIPADHLDQLDEEARTQQWTQILDDPAGLPVQVAVSSGTVIGFISVGRSRDQPSNPLQGEVYALYVDPEWWRQGVGRRLHDRGVDLMRSAGFASATLWVLDGNERAIAFYLRQEWVDAEVVQHDERPTLTLTERQFRLDLKPRREDGIDPADA